MPNLFEKYGMERAAASLASDDDKDWASLSNAEKEQYYAKVRREKQLGGNRSDKGTVPANDMYKRMGR